MNVGDRMKNIRKQRGMSADTLAELIGVSRSTVFRYEKGDIEKMPMDIVAKVAKALNVALPELMGLSGEETKSQIDSVITQLNEQRQQRVLTYANNQLKEQNNKIVELPSPYQVEIAGVVSAGTGEYQDDNIYKDVITYRGKLPSEYDYALVINGNSMEPLFTDGQVIFIRNNDEDTSYNGQIVIAVVNGDAFVKKLSITDEDCRLVSLNKDYDDIVIHDYDDLEIKGTVVL